MTGTSQKIYFASDFHLGAPHWSASREREQTIVEWLDSIKDDAREIFLVGDIFDFWFEYKRVIPKGFVRLQGKLAELTDAGILVHVFTGNHDMWIFDYLPAELGVLLHREPIERCFFGKTYFIGHGDGLGPGDRGYKFIKKVFSNPFCQWCFARLHPNFGLWLAEKSSQTSRAKTGQADEVYYGNENEWLVLFCEEQLKKKHTDFFIFGHRHLPLQIELQGNSTYFNLGEWMNYRTFLEVSETDVELKAWKNPDYAVSEARKKANSGK